MKLVDNKLFYMNRKPYQRHPKVGVSIRLSMLLWIDDEVFNMIRDKLAEMFE